MAFQRLSLQSEYVLGVVAKYLTRFSSDGRHNYGHLPDGDPRANVAENWRFPWVETPGIEADSYTSTRVTFIYCHPQASASASVAVLGSFANLYEPIPLEQVPFAGEPTSCYAVTLILPSNQVFTYKFLVDGEFILDPVNPQLVTLDNGRQWSRLFTNYCTVPLSFERWEYAILKRLVNRILPFRTKEGKNFVDRYYFGIDKQGANVVYPYAHRLDSSVGASNFIDCLLAREEAHHLIDYKLCLSQINKVLRSRNPFVYPEEMPTSMYAQLYQQMADNSVPGWNYDIYREPRYFWEMLRRHAYTGAFSHPKYGGNVAAAGWSYLQESFIETGHEGDAVTAFDWRRSIEKPLGVNPDYNG